MSVRWYDRILIVLGGLLLLAVGALAIIAGGGLLTSLLDTAWSHEFNLWLAEKWQWTPVIIIGGIVLVLLGVLMIARSLRRGDESSGKYYTLQSEPEGNVRISVHAIDHLVHKCIDRYGQVISSKVKIGGQEDNMEITLHMTLHTDVRIPGLVDELREDIRKSLEKSAGVTVQKVQIYVDAAKDDKDKDGVRYLEDKGRESNETAGADSNNTASYYTPPVHVTEEKAYEAPVFVKETAEEAACVIDLEAEARLSSQAFPFSVEEAGVPPKIVTEDSPTAKGEKEEAAHE